MAGKVHKPRRIRTRVYGNRLLPLALFVCSGAALVSILRPQPAATVPPPEIQIASEMEMLLIPTPSRPVAKGERLSAVPFSEIQWPRHRLGGEYITNVVEYRDWVAMAPLSKLVPVPLSSLSADGSDANAVVEGIPQAMRAITVRVDPESAVEGWARSGNYVDVIVLRPAADPSLGLEAKLIAENIKILSAGRSTVPIGGGDTAPQAPATITLLTSQEDSLKIKTAASIGKLTFSLRGSGDKAPAEILAMDQKRLLGGAEAIPVNQANYDGYAKGPDGRVYVLGDDSKWAISSFVPARLAGRPAFPAVQNGGGVESGQAALDAKQAADRAADQGGRD